MARSRSIRLVLVAALATAALSLAGPSFAATATVTGWIEMADGSPAAGRVALAPFPPDAFPAEWTDLAPDGTYAVSGPQGPVQLYVLVPAPQPTDQDFVIEVLTTEFTLGSAGHVVRIRLPEVVPVRAHVVGANGDPVADAAVSRLSVDYGTVAKTTEEGLSMNAAGGPTGAEPSAHLADESGVVEVPALLGSSGLQIRASAPGRGAVDGSVGPVTATTDVTLTLPDLLRIQPGVLPPAQVGTNYTQTLQGAGGRTPYTWSVVGGALPMGLDLSSGGVISGAPTTEQTASFRVQLRDGSTPAVLATRDLSLTVATVAVTTSTLADAVVVKAYSATLTASGGKPGYSWSLVSGSLPNGLTLSSLGKITGTPRTIGAATFTVRAQDTSSPVKKAGLRQLTLTVGPMTVADVTLPRGLAGKPYPATALKTVGGKSGFAWSVVSGALPSGLKLSATGTISGAPVGPGASTFTVRVTDSNLPKNVATREFTIVVDPMTIITSSLPNGAVRKLYPNQTLKASGGKGTLTWVVASGALPPGLRLSSGGLISGIPTAAGTFTFTVRVSDTSLPRNVAVRTLALTVT